MNPKETTTISVKVLIDLPVEQVWKRWTTPEDIINWNAASKDWHTPFAENNLRSGGKFNYRMEARDGSVGFDFEGVYDRIVIHKQIEYTLGDGRKVNIVFTAINKNKTEIIETFEAENTNSIELQRTGWQAILNNFKKYAEQNNLIPGT
ncbi:MAG: SRPBCC family protein [Bacteroidales bacterium]|nr:SRPBCC family protein [Bacteroidales bacterium]